MKVSKKIIRELNRRTRAANTWFDSDYKISRWLEERGIEADPDDTFGGAEGIVHPEDSAKRIIKAIEEA